MAAAIAYASKAITDDHRLDACIWLEKFEQSLELLYNKLDVLVERLLIDEAKNAETGQLNKFRKLREKHQNCSEAIKCIIIDENNSKQTLSEIKRIRKNIANLESEYQHII